MNIASPRPAQHRPSSVKIINCNIYSPGGDPMKKREGAEYQLASYLSNIQGPVGVVGWCASQISANICKQHLSLYIYIEAKKRCRKCMMAAMLFENVIQNV